MGYGQDACWTEFSPQQHGRMNCWTNEILTAWDCGAAVGACCDGQGCIMGSASQCSLSGGVYQGDWSHCEGAGSIVYCGDCNANGIKDACDISCGAPGGPCDLPGCGQGPDCNGNLVLDSCDFISMDSRDCNSNQIPDECDASQAVFDCNVNLIPDDCEGLGVDCNSNASRDDCDIIAGSSEDCNYNLVPDECESAADCDSARPQLYWGDLTERKIYRSGILGGEIEEVISDVRPKAMAYDPVDRKIYWSDADVPQIYRANLDGSDVELFIEGEDRSDGLAVDYHNRLLYWTTSTFVEFGEQNSNSLRRIHLDGTPHEEGLLEEDDHDVYPYRDIFLDLPANKVHFMDSRLKSMLLVDRFPTETIFSAGALDSFATFAFSPVRRMHLIPKRHELIQTSATGFRFGGFEAPVERVAKIWPDPFDRQVYWTESLSRSIRRLSGDHHEPQILLSGLTNPGCLVLVRRFDCNHNSIDDFCEISCGTPGGSCDNAGCGAGSDSDRDGLLDGCDVFPDCNDNGINDEVEVANQSYDGNFNRTPDICDITLGTSRDCDHNQRPDECDVLADTYPDCNKNLAPDHCEIAEGSLSDMNGDQIPDECMSNIPLSDDSQINKSRFISFSVPSVVREATAIRVKLLSLHDVTPPYTGGPSVPFFLFEGSELWVGPPVQLKESSAGSATFYGATLRRSPYYHDWSTVWTDPRHR